MKNLKTINDELLFINQNLLLDLRRILFIVNININDKYIKNEKPIDTININLILTTNELINRQKNFAIENDDPAFLELKENFKQSFINLVSRSSLVNLAILILNMSVAERRALRNILGSINFLDKEEEIWQLYLLADSIALKTEIIGETNFLWFHYLAEKDKQRNEKITNLLAFTDSPPPLLSVSVLSTPILYKNVERNKLINEKIYDEILNNKIQEQITAKDIRLVSDLIDIVPTYISLIVIDLLNSELLKFLNVMRAMEAATMLMYIPLVFLIAGGIASCFSSLFRLNQLKDELLQIKHNKTERIALKKHLLKKMRGLNKYSQNYEEKIASYRKILRKLNRGEKEIRAEINFQRAKFWIFGIIQSNLGIGTISSYSVLSAAGASTLFVSPVICLVLTLSMAYLSHRYFFKWQEAKERYHQIENSYDEDIQQVKMRIVEIDSILTNKSDEVIAKNGNLQQLKNELTELRTLQGTLEQDKKIELDCAKADITQRRNKFLVYTAAFTLSLVATGLAIAVAFVVSVPLVIAAITFAVAAVTVLGGYWGYNFIQKTLLKASLEAPKNEVKDVKNAEQNPRANNNKNLTPEQKLTLLNKLNEGRKVLFNDPEKCPAPTRSSHTPS